VIDDDEASAVPLEGQEMDSDQQGPIVALELLLLSLARTQTRLANTGDEAKKVMEELRREWSEAYRIQLTR
jgi:hypothetical protein